MGVIRINQNKILVGGDKKKAAGYIGSANSQMEILKQDMSFQKLSQGVRQVKLFGDVIIKCIKIFNYQECRIFVPPTPSGEEHIIPPLYYYIRIKNTLEELIQLVGSGGDAGLRAQWKLDNFPNLEMDRIIVWECHSETVTLDVDVFSETVYSESGGVEVNTALSEAEQIELAKQYIEQIDDSEIESPYDPFPDYFDSGYMGDPYELHNKCEDDPVYGVVDYSEKVSSDSDDYYHMIPGKNRRQPSSLADCASGATDYETHYWEDLEEVAEYYPKTAAPSAYGEETIGNVTASPSFAGTVLYGDRDEDGNYSILDGVFFAPLITIPQKAFHPFFVILKSNTLYPVAMSRSCVPDVSHEGLATIGITRSSEFSVVTPFEELLLEEIMAKSDDGCACVPACWCNYIGGSASGGGKVQGNVSIGSFWPSYPCPSAYGEFTVLRTSGGEKFFVKCNILEDYGAGNGFSTFIYRERNSTVESKYRRWATGPQDCEIIDYAYDMYAIIYILIPEALEWEDVDTGEKRFFDIYEFREEEGDINSNRALDLEEYFMALIKEKKDEYRFNSGGGGLQYYMFESLIDDFSPPIYDNADEFSTFHHITSGFLLPIED